MNIIKSGHISCHSRHHCCSFTNDHITPDNLQFSPNSEHVLFTIDRPEKECLVIDGKELRCFEDIFYHCSGVRRMGAAAIDLAYVASGHFEAFWELGLNPWDMAGGESPQQKYQKEI